MRATPPLNRRFLRGTVTYRKHEQKGFSTPTKKVEFSSTILKDLGYDPLPTFKEVPESPISRPDLLTTLNRDTISTNSAGQCQEALPPRESRSKRSR